MHLETLIRDLLDTTPCSFDHHGYCQSHGWSNLDRPCPQQRLKELLDQPPQYMVTVKVYDSENHHQENIILSAADENEAEAIYYGQQLSHGAVWHEIGGSVRSPNGTIKKVESAIAIFHYDS